jgi:hypothetical protein
MQKRRPLLIAAIAIPTIIGGWALFRPELLFVNQTVNEALPTNAAETAETLAAGKFISYAHETKGEAEVVRIGNKNYLQLKNFHTSNGPDVRVYLLKGTDGSKGGAPDRISLGPIKGNIGTQNYEIPAGTNLDEYQAVSIWCERFAVGFGGANLEPTKKVSVNVSQPEFQIHLAGLKPIIVTTGKVQGDKAFAGTSSIIEENDKRFVESNFTKLGGSTFKIRLVKKESLSLGAFPNAPFENLGTLVKGKKRVAISKSLDLWLYRSIAVIDSKDKVVAFVNLRSSQEKQAFAPNPIEII